MRETLAACCQTEKMDLPNPYNNQVEIGMNKVGNDISAANAQWHFSEDMVNHFDQHIRRSVPLYAEGHKLISQLSDYFLADGSLAYEFGCATGTLTRLIAERNKDKQIRLVGIDEEPGMIKQAGEKCADLESVELITADLLETELKNADLIVAYYTMQFIRPRFRQDLFNRVYETLNWGGAFILFEKVRAPDARFQDITSGVYTDYKLEQGFNETEIVNKARSLKGVLEPFSTQGNMDLMHRAGFVDIMSIFKYVCFEGFLAIK